MRYYIFENGMDINIYKEDELEEAKKSYDYLWRLKTDRERILTEYYCLYAIEVDVPLDEIEGDYMDYCVEMIENKGNGFL